MSVLGRNNPLQKSCKKNKTNFCFHLLPRAFSPTCLRSLPPVHTHLPSGGGPGGRQFHRNCPSSKIPAALRTNQNRRLASDQKTRFLTTELRWGETGAGEQTEEENMPSCSQRKWHGVLEVEGVTAMFVDTTCQESSFFLSFLPLVPLPSSAHLKHFRFLCCGF